MKYGSLSVLEGRVAIETRTTRGTLHLKWQEAGGPRVEQAPTREGFGTKLSQLSIVQQLGGSISREWRPEGLVVEVVVLLERLVR
jgi:two-component sensor histidine kinase